MRHHQRGHGGPAVTGGMFVIGAVALIVLAALALSGLAVLIDWLVEVLT